MPKRRVAALSARTDLAELAAELAARTSRFLNWLPPPLMNPPKMEPPRAKCIGEGDNLLGTRIILDEAEQNTFKIK